MLKCALFEQITYPMHGRTRSTTMKRGKNLYKISPGSFGGTHRKRTRYQPKISVRNGVKIGRYSLRDTYR